MKNKLLSLLLIVALLACTVPVNAGRRGPYRPNLKDFQRELQRIGGSNLVAYWPIDDVSGTEFRDLGPNNEPLTITGVTLDQRGPPQLGKSGLWDGINDVGSQKVYEDETGSSWGPTVHGFSLVDGNAFLRVEGVDLSPFAGVAGSDTPYMVVVKDDAGSKVAWGYIAEADAAEALATTGGPLNDGELIANPGFETAGAGDPDFWANWLETAGDGAIADEGTLVHGGSHAAKLTAGAPTQFTRIVQIDAVTAGKRYKLTFWTRGDGTYEGRYRLYDVDNAGIIFGYTATGVSGTAYTEIVIYFTAPAGCTQARLELYCPSTDTGIAYFDDVSIKEVLHVGTDGVHLVSTRDGSTRNWAGIDGSFAYNDSAYTFQVFSSLFQQTGSLTVGAWVKMGTAASQEIISKLIAADNDGFVLRTDASGFAEFAIGDGTDTQAATDDAALNTTGWYLLVGVHDGTNAYVYVQGIQEASQAQSAPGDLSQTFGIGSDGVGFGNFNGSHAFLMSKALTAAQVKRLFSIGSRTHGG